MTVLTEQEVLDAWGDTPNAVSDSLARFASSARALSSGAPRLIDQHPQQWVGLYDGHVEVAGNTLKSVMEQIDAKGYPKEETIVRFLDRDPKTLIL